jgi:hypothetical protein
MRKILPLGLIAIFFSAISQMGFLLNADVINGHHLTLMGVVIGLVVGIIYFVYRKKQSLKYMNILIEHTNRPWYQKPPNYPMTFFFCILGGMISVTLINNMPDTGNQKVESYIVTNMAEQRVKYDYIEYLVLSNEQQKITYRPKEGHSFKLGQQVKVTIEIGLLGFAQVLDVAAKNS